MKYCIGLAAIALANPALAGIVTPLSTNRYVTAQNRETSPQTTVNNTGPALGAWQSTALASNIFFSDPNFNINGSPCAVTSTQSSTVSSAGAGFSGFVFIDYGGVLLPNDGTFGENRCDMTFQVDGTCPYDFQTTVTSNNVSETHGSIFLRNNTASLNVFSFTATGAQSGVLAPGNYTLSILIQGSSHGSLSFDGRTQIDATFNVPAPAAGIAMSLFAVIALPRRRR